MKSTLAGPVRWAGAWLIISSACACLDFVHLSGAGEDVGELSVNCGWGFSAVGFQPRQCNISVGQPQHEVRRFRHVCNFCTKSSLDGRFSCFAIPGLRVLGIFLALLILVVVVVDNYGNSDAASKLVHSSGALAGAMVSLLDLVFRNGVGKGSFGPNKRGGRFCLDSAGVHTKTPPRCCAIDHSRTKERSVP